MNLNFLEKMDAKKKKKKINEKLFF